MPIDAILFDRATGDDLLTLAGPGAMRPVLITHTVAQAIGVFKSRTETTAGTFTVVEAKAGSAIVLTDLLISVKKKALASMTIRFFDSANTVDVFAPDVGNAEVNMAIPFAGRWAGWSGANLVVTTSANVSFTVAVGYSRIQDADDFATWDAKR